MNFNEGEKFTKKGKLSEEVEVFVDGCSLGNPGPGGYGVLIREGNREWLISGGSVETTNNRMELTAVIKALSQFKQPKKIKVYSDSEYVIQGATKWLSCWEQRGFKTSEKKPVKNQDLWKELKRWLCFHRVTFIKVPAHSGHLENEKVDRLAKKEAQRWKKRIVHLKNGKGQRKEKNS